MHIIEMAGLPGCGKSTLLNKLAPVLRQQGRNVYTHDDFMKREPLFKNCGILFLSQKINPQNRNCMNWIKRYCASAPENDSREIFKKELIELYYRTHLIEGRKSEDIILLDEGFVQNFTSLFFTEEIPHDITISGVFKNLIDIRCKYQFVKCNISIDESSLRINKRARKNDRYRNLDIESLKKALLTKNRNIEYLLSMIEDKKKINLDMNSSVQDNIDIIIKEIFEGDKKIQNENSKGMLQYQR